MSSNAAVRTVTVPGYEGRGVTVNKDAIFRVTDVEGCQIGDLFVMSAEDPEECLSPAVTRTDNFRLFPRVGDELFSNRHHLMITFLKDTSPGLHDMAFAPCDRQFYEKFGDGPDHPNCRDNFFSAVRALGIECSTNPDPINLFQNTVPDANGDYIAGRTASQPGDYVEFRAEMDLIVVLTACSADIEFDGVLPIGGTSTPLRLEVYE